MFLCGPDGAPGPVGGLAHEAGSHRVREDVGKGGFEVLVVVDHPGRESLCEERAAPTVASVVLARVVTLEPLECRRETLDRTIDDGVKVGSHQTVGVKAQIPPPNRALQEDQEVPPVLIVPKKRRLVNSPSRQVEVPIRELGTKDPGHAPTLKPN
jgi:hypothetical protein